MSLELIYQVHKACVGWLSVVGDVTDVMVDESSVKLKLLLESSLQLIDSELLVVVSSNWNKNLDKMLVKEPY